MAMIRIRIRAPGSGRHERGPPLDRALRRLDRPDSIRPPRRPFGSMSNCNAESRGRPIDASATVRCGMSLARINSQRIRSRRCAVVQRDAADRDRYRGREGPSHGEPQQEQHIGQRSRVDPEPPGAGDAPALRAGGPAVRERRGDGPRRPPDGGRRRSSGPSGDPASADGLGLDRLRHRPRRRPGADRPAAGRPPRPRPLVAGRPARFAARSGRPGRLDRPIGGEPGLGLRPRPRRPGLGLRPRVRRRGRQARPQGRRPLRPSEPDDRG